MKVISVGFSVVGAFIVVHCAVHPQVHGTANVATGSHTLIGFAAILLNVSCSSAYFVAQKGILRSYSPVYATALSYASAASIVFVLACIMSGTDWDAWSMNCDCVTW